MREAHARTPRADPPPERQQRPALRVVDAESEHDHRRERPERRAALAEGRPTIRIAGRPEPHRRPSPTATRAAARPDRVAMWAVLLGLFMVLMAAATSKAETRYRYATLGDRVLKRGDRGSDVKTLQLLLIRRGYELPSASGSFGPKTQQVVRRFQKRSKLEVDGTVGPDTRSALAKGWPVRKATWYGPGFYGNRTACGQTLRHKSWGVAHRTVACGTPVPVKFGTRLVIAPVIDRGPYTSGISYDLTERVAKALHMTTTSRVRAGR
jgi:rare lipoprotein A (peptidoglycan hydrolase)